MHACTTTTVDEYLMYPGSNFAEIAIHNMTTLLENNILVIDYGWLDEYPNSPQLRPKVEII